MYFRNYRLQRAWLFKSLWKNISSKNAVLVLSEILRPFVNILTTDVKYSLSVKVSV